MITRKKREETETNLNKKNVMKTTKESNKVEATDNNFYLSRYKTTIKESDIKSIKGRNWISDSLLTLWMQHLQQVVHNKNENMKRVCRQYLTQIS